MVSQERDPERNNRRRPRTHGQPSESEDEGSDIDDEDIDEYSEGEDDSDDELEIPDDPAHTARMQILRAENAALEEEARQRGQVLVDMQERTERMRYHTARVREEVDRLKALSREREKEATNAAGANGCRPYQDLGTDRREQGGDDKDQDRSGASLVQSKKC